MELGFVLFNQLPKKQYLKLYRQVLGALSLRAKRILVLIAGRSTRREMFLDDSPLTLRSRFDAASIRLEAVAIVRLLSLSHAYYCV